MVVVSRKMAHYNAEFFFMGCVYICVLTHVCMCIHWIFLCHTWGVLGVYSWLCARDHSLLYSEDHIECQRLNTGRPHARKIVYSLYFCCGPNSRDLTRQKQDVSFTNFNNSQPHQDHQLRFPFFLLLFSKI